MKQAKFALTAVAVLAVVGGALAFKASRNATVNYFVNTRTTATAPLQCTGKVTLSSYQTIDQNLGTLVIPSATFVSKTASCQDPITVFKLD